MNNNHLLTIGQKSMIQSAGIVCLIAAAATFFIDSSLTLTLAVFGVEGIILKRLHGQRVEVAAVACWVGAIILLGAMMFTMISWNILGGIVLLVGGAYLWSLGY